MSETVDTRVVEAKFDSKQFEQGVDKTVKKLDELKKSLTDATTGKTVAEIGNKVQDATDKASNSLEKLQDRFTSFTGMLKQKLLSGIADEIVGVFFKIKSSFENMVTSLSSAQVSVGMQRYTDILTSVRTLVAAGVNQDKAYESIERLGQYADQTSYSLDSMVSTMSKFKTAGADIDTAARMIEGLSNAAASMGVNAQEAERAYLNLQQAYSKKVMLQNDWISFESLPMVGTQFNQAIIDAAVKVGTLEKDKNGTYKTKKKAGTKVKAAKGITADNLGANLASRWFTDEVMEEVFGNTYYFSEIGIDEVNALKKKEKEIRDAVKKEAEDPAKDIKNIDDEVNKRLQEYFDETNKVKIETKQSEINERKTTAKLELDQKKITKDEYDKLIKELDDEMKKFEAENTLTAFAYNAFRAGQEARSFTDVLNTLKDAISRGWATSFELIFGKLDEAAEFFTSLTESKFAEGIYAIGEFRNAVLQNWRDAGGRETLLGVLEYMDEITGSIWKKLGLIADEEELVSQYYKENFDLNRWKQLRATEGEDSAEEYKQSIKDQAQEYASSASPFEKTAKELGQRLMILGRDIRDFFEKVHKWFTEADTTGTSRLQRITNIIEGFGTIFNGAMTAAGMGLEFIGETYTKFRPVFDQLWLAIEKVLTPIFNLFNPDIKDEQGKNAYKDLQNFLDNLGKIADKIAGPLATIVNVLGEVAAFFVDMAVGTFKSNLAFFSDALGLLLEVLGFGSAQTDNGKSVAQGIAEDITSLGDACKDAFQAVSDFFSSVIADIRTWLGLSDQTTEGGNIFQNIANWWNTNESLQTIKQSIDDFVVKVGDWIKNIPENISKFAINIGDFFKSMFYTKKEHTVYDGPNGTHTVVEWVKTDLLLWIEQAIADIKAWFVDLPNNIINAGINIGDFFKSIFFEKKEHTVYGGKNGTHTITEWVKKDFTKDLENAFVEIGDWIKDIPNKFIGLFYQNVETVDKRGNKITTTIETPLKQWLDKAILDTKNFIKDIPNKLKKLPSLISEFFKGIFYKKEKKTLVLGPNGNKTEIEVAVKTPLKEFLDTLVKAVSDFVKELPTHIHNAFVSIGDFFEMIWNELLGNSTDSTTDEATQKIDDTVQEGIDNSLSNVTTNTFLGKIQALGSDIWNGILTIFTGNSDKEFNSNWIAEKVKEGIDNIGSFADKAWKESSKFIEELPNTIASIFTKEDGGSKEEGGIKGAIIRFANRIGEWISGVPNTILAFWRNAEAQIGKLWDNILGWITGKNAIEEELKNPDDQAAYEYLSKNGNPAYRAIAESFKKDALHNEWRSDNPILANLEDFFGNLKDYIVDKITHFPENVANGLASGVDLLNQLLEGVTGWFSTENEKGSLEKQAEELLAEDFEKPAEGNAFLDAISKFGATISLMITKTIPGFISEGFEWVSNHAESWWNSLTNLFSGEGIDGKVDESGLSLGGKIRKGIENGLKLVSDLFTKPLFDQKEYERLLDVDPTGYGATMYSRFAVHSPILEFFRNIVVGIGDMFKNAGPVILEGINTALNWVGEKVNLLTGLFNDAHNQNKKFTDVLAEKVAGPETEDSPFYRAIQNLGQTIKNIITKVIPEFISSAFTEISMQVQDLLPKIFGGGNNQEVEKEIAKGITEQFDQKTYDYILQQSGSKEEAEKYRKRFDKQNKTIVDQAVESAKAANIQLQDLYGENGLTDYAKYAEYMGMKYDPTKTSGIFGALADEAEPINNATNGVESVGGFLSSLKDVFSSFGENKLLQFGVLLAVVALIIDRISDLVDNVMFIDDAIGWNAKWVGIGSLLTAISGIISWCVILASSGDTERLNAVYGVFDKLKEFINSIKDMVKEILALLSVKELFGTAGSFFEWRNSKQLANTGTGDIAKGGVVASFLQKILAFLGIAEGVDIITLGIEKGIRNIAAAIDSVASVTGGIKKIVEDLNYVKNDVGSAIESAKELGGLFNTIRELFTIKELVDIQNVDVYGQRNGTYYERDGKFYFLEDIEGFTEVFEEEVTEAEYLVGTQTKRSEVVTKSIVDEFYELSKLLARMSGAFAEFKNALSVKEDTKLITDDISSLITMTEEMKTFGDFGKTEDFENFKLAFTSLGAALSIYSFGGIKSGDYNTEVVDTAITVLSDLFTNEKLQSLITSLSDTSLPSSSELLEQSERMVIFAGALSSIANACSKLTEESGKNIESLFNTVSEIPTSEYNGKKISEIAVNFGVLGNAIGAFAFETSDLTESNVKNAEKALDMLLRIAVGLKDIPNDSVLAEFFTGKKGLDDFGANIETLGRHLKAFFDSIENIDAGTGKSVSYNRSNLQMAILAVQGIAESVYILAKTPHINAFDHSIQGGLINYLGDLGKLAEGIMTFINTVNTYTDTTKYGVINYDFVFNAIDAIGKIASSFDKIPNKYDKNVMGGRIETLGKILFGDKENGGTENDGFLGGLNEFLGRVVGISKQGEYEIKLSEAAAIVQSYSDMVAEIMMILLKFGNINYEDFVASYYNASSPAANLEKKENNIFDILLPSFQNINDNFSTYEEFLNNTSQYNKLGLDNAVAFFEGLGDLASALYIFSQKDEATGEYNTTKGLTKLMEFNWESFRSVISDMNNVFAEEGLDVSPKITPVFELSDDFKSKVAEMRRELGIQIGENGEWISPDLKVTISAEGLPELGSIDKKLDTLETISKALDTLQTSVDNFDNSLSNMRFIINGEELSLAIAPSMDKALGLAGFIGARGVITSGGFVNESGP